MRENAKALESFDELKTRLTSLEAKDVSEIPHKSFAESDGSHIEDMSKNI